MKHATKSSSDTANYSTPALENGLDILELLAQQPAGLTKSQIARELERTVSEVFRMLICLERRGYISHVQGDQYALTLKLFTLVQEHPPTERLIAEATTAMHRFAQDTLQSCHMGVIADGRVVILAQVKCASTERLLRKARFQCPYHGCLHRLCHPRASKDPRDPRPQQRALAECHPASSGCRAAW